MSIPRLKLKYAAGGGQYGLNFPASGYVDDGIRLVRTTDLATGRLASGETGIFVPKEAVSAQDMLAPGDLLLSRSGTIGRAFLVPAEAAGMAWAGFLVRYKPGPDVNGRYLYYCTQSSEFQYAVRSDAVTSTIQNFNADRYDNLRIPLPTLDEQRAIADYLDHETAQIDALVAKQEEFIALMRERKAVQLDLVFQASQATRRTQVGRMLSGRPSYGVLVPRYVTAAESSPFVRVGDLLRLSPDMDLPRISSTQSREYNRTRLVGGELLLGVVGRMGVAAVAPMWLGGANVARAVAVLRLADPSHAPLLCAWLGTSHFLRQANSATSGDSVQPTLGMADLAHFELHWPTSTSAAEATLDRLSRIDALIAKAEEHIALAKERRSGLITAAVTGQIDVRTAARKAG